MHANPVPDLSGDVVPLLNPSVPLLQSQEGNLCWGEVRTCYPYDHVNTRWLLAFDGKTSLSQLLKLDDQYSDRQRHHDRHHLVELVESGIRAGAVIDARSMPHAFRWADQRTRSAIFTALISHTSAEIDRRMTTALAVVGQGDLARALTTYAQEQNFHLVDSPADAAIVIFVSRSHPEGFDHDWSHQWPRAHLHVAARGTRALVGPLVIPRLSSCFRCAYLHAKDAYRSWPDEFRQWRRLSNDSSADPFISRHAALFALLVTGEFFDGTARINTAWHAQLPWGQFHRVPRPPHPLCGCQLAE